MTDNVPDISPDSPSDASRENSDVGLAVCPSEGGAEVTNTADADIDTEISIAVPASLEDGPIDCVEDGVALHIVPPQDPGTIFVAVAEPADFDDGLPFSGMDTGSSAFNMLDGLRNFEEEDLSAEAGTGQSMASTPIILPDYDGLTEVAAVRVSGLGPALFFTTGGVVCKPDDKVIVAMEEGQAYGMVLSSMRADPAHLEGVGDEGGIRPLLRSATDKDILMAEDNAALAVDALEYCRDCIRERNLDMKLVDVLVLHDRGKMIFYFTAPARIDFRELVKDLVRRYRTRIELRQIGVRHETQMVGALGNCGMVCCCRRYLRKFAPVAIKMAKEQNVFLNPVKISGICGRLLCCLAYEQEHYDEFYRSCPKLGKKYQTNTGLVRVLRASLFRESVTVLTEAGEEIEFTLVEWEAQHPFRPSASPQQIQGGRKQEGQGGDARQRKNESKDRRPGSGSGREQELPVEKGHSRCLVQDDDHDHSRHSARDVVRDSEPEVGRDATWPGKTAAVAQDESTDFSVEITSRREIVASAESGNVPATQSRTSGIVRAREIDSANSEVWDMEDAGDTGESIFGLAPQRHPSASGQEPVRDGGRRENTHRRKHSRHRKPRSGPGA